MVRDRRRARLEIRLLGPPEVTVAGAPIAVDTRKAIAILALLAADERAYGREELAALLWPDSDDLSARGALRRTLSTLHAAVGDGPLDIGRERVGLVPAQAWVDVAELERLARSDRPADLARAAAIARGPFLAGFSLRDSADFDDWRAARSASVERVVLGVLDRLAAALEAAGDLAGAIEAAGRRLDLDPLDEAGHVHLMELYAGSGDRAAAIRQYRACVATLERELGVAPLATTTARYEAIRDALDAAPAAPAVPAHVLATATDRGDHAVDGDGTRPIVGRDTELRDALISLDAAEAGAGPVLVITGEAGIGKTALGEAIAAEVRRRGGSVVGASAYPGEREIPYGTLVEAVRGEVARPDGPDRIATLDPTTRTELARLLPAVAPGVRLPEARGDAARTRLIAALADGLTTLAAGDRTGMLWFDDLQWADGATLDGVAYLVRRLAGRRVLVVLAWRPEDLDATGAAFAERVRRVPGARILTLDRLDRSAVAALVAASGATPGDAAIDRLATASEGLPLYVVEALAADLALPDVSMPQGVRSVLRARLDAVGETAGQILTAASVIGRSFDLATVRHASGRSEEETVDAIDELLARGLIREVESRYDFAHGGLRDLAYERASLARRRLLHRRVAEALRLDLAGHGRDDLGRLVAVAANERDAGRDAEAAEAFRAAGARAAAVFANREAIDHDEAALALGHPDVVWLRTAIGELRTRLGDYDGAIGALEAAVSVATAQEAPVIELALARAHLRRGDLIAADDHLDAGLALVHDDTLEARLAVDRAVVRRRTGDMDGAAAWATAARDAASRAGDTSAIGAADRLLGLVALDRGDLETARQSLTRAVVAADADPDPTARIAALTGLAMVCAAADDVDAAVSAGADAVASCRRVGDRHLEAAVENHLADILHAAGREEEAMVHLRRAVEAFAEVGDDPADPDPGIWMLAAS